MMLKTNLTIPATRNPIQWLLQWARNAFLESSQPLSFHKGNTDKCFKFVQCVDRPAWFKCTKSRTKTFVREFYHRWGNI